jgi:hypothetical protein
MCLLSLYFPSFQYKMPTLHPSGEAYVLPPPRLAIIKIILVLRRKMPVITLGEKLVR